MKRKVSIKNKRIFTPYSLPPTPLRSKTALGILVVLVVIFSWATSALAAADEDIKITIDGKVLDFGRNEMAPYELEGRIRVPARKVFEAMGCEVRLLNPDEVEISKQRLGYKMFGRFQQCALQAFTWGFYNRGIDNKEYLDLDVIPLIVKGTFVVPLRTVAEAMGCHVYAQSGWSMNITVDPRLMIDGAPADFEGMTYIIVNDQAMVPLDQYCALKNYQVLFNQKSGRIIICNKDEEKTPRIRMNIDSTKAIVSGREVTLDAPPVIRFNLPFVPLRFMAEISGAKVLWDEKTGNIAVDR
ncbi:MAG: copper amine oxidase N-terminal domain-containing protein [Clostridiales bacterium]|nr:copper amine oxidase N-terminal domain-containing protein [Clostridiales bacterium]